METYRASLDTRAKISTAFIFLMAAGIITMRFWRVDDYGFNIAACIIVLAIVITYFFKVQAYLITDKTIIIKRPFSLLNKEISLSKIENISILNKEDFKWTVRTFGDGGLFGYYGFFTNPELGRFRMYATNKRNGILIILKDTKERIVISPDDTTMADVLQKYLKRPA